MLGRIAGILFLAAAIPLAAAQTMPDAPGGTGSRVFANAAAPDREPAGGVRADTTGGSMRAVMGARAVMGVSVTVVAAPDAHNHASAGRAAPTP